MPRSPSIALMVSCLTRAFRKRRAGLCRWHPGDASTNTETLVGADARHTCRISAPSVPLTVGRAGGSGGLFDPESLHQRLERRPLHAEPRGRTPGASQHPVRLLEGTQDVGAVDTAARRVMVANRRGSPTPRKVVERHLEPPAARKDHRALDQVRELADVPGPRVPTERVQRLARDDLDPAVHGTREPLDEVAHQGGNVLGPLAERRGLDREHVQPVVEIVPEPLLFHHPKEVAVRRGDEADVDLDRLRTAVPLELLLLQDAQQLRLELERDLADLVEEQRAAVGHLEAADLLGDGAGEGAPLVPEELALEETGRNRGAVELHERAVAAVASVVDGPREQPLARARFAEKQDRRIDRCDDLHLLERPVQRGTVADDVLERLLAPNLALEVQAFLGELVLEARDLLERHGILDRDGHELRDLAHELDLGVGVGRVVAPRESERPEPRANGREGQDAEASDALVPDYRHPLGPPRFSAGVRDDQRLQHREGPLQPSCPANTRGAATTAAARSRVRTVPVPNT